MMPPIISGEENACKEPSEVQSPWVDPSFNYGFNEIGWLLEQAFPALYPTVPIHSVLCLPIVLSASFVHRI
jgi:hypothetical protein